MIPPLHVDADRADLPRLAAGQAGRADRRSLRADLARLDRRLARSPNAGEALEDLGRDPEVAERRDHRLLERSDVREDVAVHRAEVEDRIGDELPGPVVGDLPAAVRLGDLDALHAVPVLAHRQMAGLGASALGVDGPVLEEQYDVGDLAVATRRRQALLQRQALGVRNRARPNDPELRCL